MALRQPKNWWKKKQIEKTSNHQNQRFFYFRNLTLSMYKKEVSLSKKVKELGLASGDMLELIEDKNNQLVEALLAINEVSVFILTLRFYFVVNIVSYSCFCNTRSWFNFLKRYMWRLKYSNLWLVYLKTKNITDFFFKIRKFVILLQ